MLSYILATEPVENVTDTSMDFEGFNVVTPYHRPETMPVEGIGRYNEPIYVRKTPDNVIYYNSENHINYGKFVYLLCTHAYTHKIGMHVYTVFPQLIPHPRLVPQCGTIQIQTTLNSMFILIVTHPRIIPHDSMKNRILLFKNYKIAKQSTK